MGKQTLIDHELSKRAAQSLLRRGLATYAEIAGVSGHNRQTIRLWAQRLDAETARQDHLEKIWAQALRQASR
jgi:hypothetical protein